MTWQPEQAGAHVTRHSLFDRESSLTQVRRKSEADAFGCTVWTMHRSGVGWVVSSKRRDAMRTRERANLNGTSIEGA